MLRFGEGVPTLLCNTQVASAFDNVGDDASSSIQDTSGNRASSRMYAAESDVRNPVPSASRRSADTAAPHEASRFLTRDGSSCGKRKTRTGRVPTLGSIRPGTTLYPAWYPPTH